MIGKTIESPDYDFVSGSVQIQGSYDRPVVYYLTKTGYEKIKTGIEAYRTGIEAHRERISNLYTRVIALEEIQRDLVSGPYMRGVITEYLQTRPHYTERQVRNYINEHYTKGYLYGFFSAWYDLIKEKKIVYTSHGKGHLRTWCLV